MENFIFCAALKILQEVRNRRAAVFCKNSQFSWKIICDGLSFEKTVCRHVCNCTEMNAITGVFL